MDITKQISYILETARKRILYFIDNQSIKTKEFLEKTRLKKGVIDKSHEKSGISDLFLSKILDAYPEINPFWILTGKGDMLLDKNQKKEVKSTERSLHKIPLYSGLMVAGSGDVANVSDTSHIEEYIDAGDWFRDATAAMRVHGDSMYPVYKSGSIVAIKEVNDKSLVLYGQDYVLETSEYRVVKRLQKSSDNSFWLCCSANEDVYAHSGNLIHEPFEVPIDAVTKLFRVLGCVTRTESSRIVLNGTV